MIKNYDGQRPRKIFLDTLTRWASRMETVTGLDCMRNPALRSFSTESLRSVELLSPIAGAPSGSLPQR